MKRWIRRRLLRPVLAVLLCSAAALPTALTTAVAQKKKSSSKNVASKNAAPAADTVKFVINMQKLIAAKQFVPNEDTVGIRGGIPPLDWGATLHAKNVKDGSGLYAVQIIFKRRNGDKAALYRDQRIPYKFKIESPTRKANDGWEVGNNSAVVLQGTGNQTVERAFNEPRQDPIASTLTGTIKFHKQFSSKHLPARDVVVYLPPGYDKDASKRYPVLYMHDGQNIFDDATASGTEWHIDEIAQSLIASGAVKPFIVVGVYNMPDQGRIDEYTPTQVLRSTQAGKTTAMGGKNAAFASMLREEIKPFIDSTYRTLPDAANTTLGGSSLGGLSSLWIGFKHPNVFGNLLVVSPSLWWDNELPVNMLAGMKEKLPLRVWLDMGSREGTEALENVRRAKLSFINLGWKEGVDFRYTEAFDGRHDEASWAARVEPMLRFLFPAK